MATPGKANLDAAILNFALNLEYLEAAFYLAAVGRLAELKAIGGSAAIILPSGFDGNTAMPFSDPNVKAYAQEIAQDELNHVIALRGALKTAAVDRPVLDIGPAFAAAANAAAYNAKLITAPTTLTPAFNPYLNDLFFLHGSFIFEDVGVTAYHGAARLVTDDSAGRRARHRCGHPGGRGLPRGRDPRPAVLSARHPDALRRERGPAHRRDQCAASCGGRRQGSGHHLRQLGHGCREHRAYRRQQHRVWPHHRRGSEHRLPGRQVQARRVLPNGLNGAIK